MWGRGANVKILYMLERFVPFVGGIETMSAHLLSALAQNGHEVQIVTSQSDVPLRETDTWQGMPLFRLPMLTSLAHRDLRGILQARAGLRGIKQAFDPDVVHIQFSGPSSMFHWDTNEGAGVPTLVTVHSVATESTPNRSLYLDTVRKADWVASVSRHMLDWTLAHAPEIFEHSSVVYNGIPAEELPAQMPALPFEPPTILWIGRMVEWKRVDRLIDAAAQVMATNGVVRLCLAGDGPERQRLEALARDRGIAERTRFTGWVDAAERGALMRKATLVAIPSEAMENLPMVALEAAGYGRPIVGSRVSGLPEIVEHERSGLLVSNLTPQTLADAISRVLTDREKAREMGRQASKLVRSRFTSTQMVDAYEHLYGRLAGPRAG